MAVVRIDPVGIGVLAKSLPVQALTHALGTAVAANVASQGLTVSSPGGSMPGTDVTAEVNTSVTDRANTSVTIAHPAGLAMEAKHGVLTKAAAAAGLEVTEEG